MFAWVYTKLLVIIGGFEMKFPALQVENAET